MNKFKNIGDLCNYRIDLTIKICDIQNEIDRLTIRLNKEYKKLTLMLNSLLGFEYLYNVIENY